jgi:hypothetical protein
VCLALAAAVLVADAARGQDPAPARELSTADADLLRAARRGDLAAVEASLQDGADPNAQGPEGRTPLLEAVAGGRIRAIRVLLRRGARPDVASAAGRTPLVEAAETGSVDAARLLIEAGADLNRSQRGVGSPVEAAERAGHNDVAAFLRRSGARSSGRSVGDTVCVRPWDGDGYCGVVEDVQRTAFKIRVTEIVGCEGGCPARAECSASRPVAGAGGVQVGDVVGTLSWCLTHTGVRP